MLRNTPARQVSRTELPENTGQIALGRAAESSEIAQRALGDTSWEQVVGDPVVSADRFRAILSDLASSGMNSTNFGRCRSYVVESRPSVAKPAACVRSRPADAGSPETCQNEDLPGIC